MNITMAFIVMLALMLWALFGPTISIVLIFMLLALVI